MTKQVAVFVGSASKTSFNHLAVKHLQKIAPASIALNVVEIGDLPLYDRDLDGTDIASYKRVQEAVRSADAVILVSPEHNGSYSAMLKNAVDVGTRAEGGSVWVGKKAGVVSANASASQKVVDALVALANAPYVNLSVSPVTASIGGIFGGAFDENGELVSEEGKVALQNFMDEFVKFVA